MHEYIKYTNFGYLFILRNTKRSYQFDWYCFWRFIFKCWMSLL